MISLFRVSTTWSSNHRTSMSRGQAKQIQPLSLVKKQDKDDDKDYTP